MGHGECAHNNGGDRVRSAVAGMGHSAVGVAGWPRRAARLLLHHLFHFHSARGLLQSPRLRHRKTELHLYGRRQGSLG